MKVLAPYHALLLLIALMYGSVSAQSPVELATKQFREYCLHESTDRGERLLDDVELPKTSPDEAKKLLGSLQPDGSWSDVDYTSNSRSSWPACNHLTRALGLVVYAQRSDTSGNESASCLTGVHRALNFWMEHDFQCPNWWYNQIGVPKILGIVAILLRDDLSSEERTYIEGTVLARAKVGSMTGQNRVWLAGNGAMRAMLISDESLLRRATSVIQEELGVSTAEGIQPDWSFHQHGPQQQFGNYGMAYAVEMSRWATVLRGTPWAFSDEKLAILRNYLLQGEDWIAWRGMMDISSCGRQLFPNSPWNKAGVMRGTMRTMAVADAGRSADYLSFVTRNTAAASSDLTNDLIGDRYFWRSDYLIHRRSQFMASLKMSSNRVVGGETVNEENLSGLHLADGATYFYRSGHEYDDIFPIWDWRMIPGTTSELKSGSLKWPSPDLKKAAGFVGAVSDGTATTAAMDFHRDSLSAKKAWFFCYDSVVCLGAGIHSTESLPVVTTINQCLLRTPVTIGRGGSRELLGDHENNLKELQWIEQDGFRYTPLEPESLRISTFERRGSWRTVFDSPTTPKSEVFEKVFTLWIAHESAKDSSYAYEVSPVEPGDRDIRLLSNTINLQAVESGGGGFIGAVFWTAGRANLDGIAIKVEEPCILQIDGGRVLIADPAQKLQTLDLEIDGKTVTVKLPRGGQAGSSVLVTTLVRAIH